MGGGAQELTGPDLTKGVPFSDLTPNRPLVGHANGESVLVVRIGDDVHAIGASCTHYGAPLADGLVVDDTIRCPWHHACFDLRSGRAVGAPALMDVACWETERSGDLIQVRTKKPAEAPTLSTHEPASVVLVGAGAAGAACAEMLRKQGYTGTITMLGAEEPGPVDRPNLSKDYLAGNAPEEWIPLGGDDRWKELVVDLRPNDPAVAIDPAAKTVTTKSGATLTYAALLFATGAEPIRLPIDGMDGPNVFTLRSLADSRAIIERAKDAKRAVVLGSSFIGLEAAAALTSRGIEVHVVSPDKVPLERVLGSEVGAFVQRIHEGKGTKFHLGTKPTSITADAVVLESGESLPCDLVVVGVGVKPRIALAEKAGLEIAAGGVAVDASLRTSAEGIWAAGDVARFHKMERIEHWQVAERSGQHVAREMLRPKDEAQQAFADIPFFWSAHHDVTLSYIGHLESAPSKIVIHGSLDDRDAAIAYKDAGGITRAVVTINRDQVSLKVEAKMERGAFADIDGELS